MPLTITKLKMWKNPGYTQQCIEVPPVGSWKLPAADWTNTTTLRPSKGSALSSIELPLSFIEAIDMSYLYMEAEDGRTPTNTIKIFGWIETVEQTASSNEAVRITWTPDYWRTFSNTAVFGKGVITKTSDSSYRRPVRINPRRFKYDSMTILSNDASYNDRVYHRCILFTYIDSGSLKLGITAGKIYNQSTQQSYTGLGISDADNLPTLLNIPSADIKGCWICPYPPLSFSSWESGANQLNFTNIGGNTTLKAYGARYWVEDTEIYTDLNTLSYTVNFETDDTNKFVVCDGYGTPFLTSPYGITIKQIRIALDIGATEAYIMVALGEDASSPNLTDYDNQAKYINQGLLVNIPMSAVSITSSALSDYYASGQRDFDINNRRIAQEKQFWSGLTGIGGSAMGGAIAGGMSGKVGAGTGAVVGAVTGLIGMGINEVVTRKTDDDLQSATDQLYSNQAGTLVTVGNTGRYMIGALPVKIVKITADSVSTSEINDQISTQGYDVEIPTSTSSSFIPVSGPIQIKSLQIYGNIPPIAKAMIKSKLENGVYVVENNPSGVAP